MQPAGPNGHRARAPSGPHGRRAENTMAQGARPLVNIPRELREPRGAAPASRRFSRGCERDVPAHTRTTRCILVLAAEHEPARRGVRYVPGPTHVEAGCGDELRRQARGPLAAGRPLAARALGVVATDRDDVRDARRQTYKTKEVANASQVGRYTYTTYQGAVQKVRVSGPPDLDARALGDGARVAGARSRRRPPGRRVGARAAAPGGPRSRRRRRRPPDPPPYQRVSTLHAAAAAARSLHPPFVLRSSPANSGKSLSGSASMYCTSLW